MSADLPANWPCSHPEEGIRPAVDSVTELNASVRPQLKGTARWGLLVMSAILTGGFSLAAALPPDPRGFGTHQALGLPPCSFREQFGIPCPSCGCTTSFALFIRGRWPEALHANAAGFLLALICAAMIPWCAMGFATGQLWSGGNAVDPHTAFPADQPAELFRPPLIRVFAFLTSAVAAVGIAQWLVWIWKR